MNRPSHPIIKRCFMTLAALCTLAISSCADFRDRFSDEDKDPRLGHYFGGQGHGPAPTRYVPPAAADPGSDIPPGKEQ